MGFALQVASLIMQRNVLAARLGRKRSLPPMLQDAHACSRCFQATNCTLLHKVICCSWNLRTAAALPTMHRRSPYSLQ